MKFAPTSSLFILACSLFQLVFSVPVPALVPDVPLKRVADSASYAGIVFTTELVANILH
jgi:hypothetical protein